MTNIIILLDYTEYCLVKFGKILSSVEKLTLSMGCYVFRRGQFAIKKKKRGEKHHAVAFSVCHTAAQYAGYLVSRYWQFMKHIFLNYTIFINSSEF